MGAVMHDIQPSFAAGELSPAMRARVDLAKYQVGLAKCYNCLVHAHGGASNRPGTKFVARLNADRLIPFQFSSIQSYMLAFGDHYIRFFMDQAPIVVQVDDLDAWSNATAYNVDDWVAYGGKSYLCIQAGTNRQPDENPTYWSQQAEYQIYSPYAAADLADINYTQSADVLYLVHPKYKPKQLSRTGHTAWSIADFAYKNGPYAALNTTTTTITPSGTTGNITLTASAPIFKAGHVGAKWKIGHNLNAASAKGVPGNTIEITAYESWRLETSGYWTGSFKIEKKDNDNNVWQTLRTFSSMKDRNYSVSDKFSTVEATGMRVVNIDFATADSTYPGKVVLECLPIYYEGHVEITAVTSSTVAQATVKKALGSNAATVDWAEGAWSEVRGYPGAIMFVNGDRLGFASTTSEPQTLWLSRVGDYPNFEVSQPTVDDDPITAPLVARQVNEIRHLVAMTNIIGLTASGEWKIWGSGANKALTPTATNADPQTYYGASNVDPLIIGSRVLFVQDKGSTVRDLAYDLNIDGYDGSDLSILAKHLFRNRRIIRWAYQQEPDSIVWAIRNDGVLLGLTYMREHEVWAWHQHFTHHDLENKTWDKFRDTAAISSNGKDEVWFLVDRTIAGQQVRFVEVMADRLPDDDLMQAYFVDAGLSYLNEQGPKTVFTGLDHLEGVSVTILADGAVMPNQVVRAVDGGIGIEFANAKSYVHVGIGYYADLQTLDVSFSLKDGTSLPRPVKIPSVTIRFENSVGCLVGPDVDRLDEIPEMRTSYGTAIALFSGDKAITIQGSYTRGGHLYVRQPYPLPITVLALMPDVSIGG